MADSLSSPLVIEASPAKRESSQNCHPESSLPTLASRLQQFSSGSAKNSAVAGMAGCLLLATVGEVARRVPQPFSEFAGVVLVLSFLLNYLLLRSWQIPTYLLDDSENSHLAMTGFLVTATILLNFYVGSYSPRSALFLDLLAIPVYTGYSLIQRRAEVAEPLASGAVALGALLCLGASSVPLLGWLLPLLMCYTLECVRKLARTSPVTIYHVSATAFFVLYPIFIPLLGYSEMTLGRMLLAGLCAPVVTLAGWLVVLGSRRAELQAAVLMAVGGLAVCQGLGLGAMRLLGLILLCGGAFFILKNETLM